MNNIEFASDLTNKETIEAARNNGVLISLDEIESYQVNVLHDIFEDDKKFSLVTVDGVQYVFLQIIED